MPQSAHLDERMMMAEGALDCRRIALNVVGEERKLRAVSRRLRTIDTATGPSSGAAISVLTRTRSAWFIASLRKMRRKIALLGCRLISALAAA